jgi:ATP-dependent DNA helicase PIF1
MLMRNIDQAVGLCNGTRLNVTDMGKNFIGCTVITRKNASDKIFVPRMNLIPSNPRLPFKFRRRQTLFIVRFLIMFSLHLASF